MNCPIYQGAQVPDKRPENANSGLWYNKFCNTWKNDFSGFTEPSKQDQTQDTGKKIWIDAMTKSPVGDKLLIQEMKDRRQKFVKACDGRSITLNSNSVLVCGLGQSHPVENGFSWHHILGGPYIPGSSVKGLVRAWAVWSKVDENENEIIRIFGPADIGKKHVGSVIFLDALPTSRVQLKTEIMTPHYDPWYQKGEAPGDWHDPNPIPFLAVEAGQSFNFAIVPAVRMDPSFQKDCDHALEWLIAALVNSGAGAKTAIGFGRFAPPDTTLPDRVNEKVWENAILGYNPGNKTVSAKAADGRSAEAVNTSDKPLISDEVIKKMKKKIVKAKVVVSPAGGKSFRLMKVDVV